MTSVDNSVLSALPTSNVDEHPENSAEHLLNQGESHPKRNFTEEEVRSILEVIASTGKFWHDWDFLKEVVSFQLKQALAQYPESQLGTDLIGPQQSSLSGETYQELVKRLDEALLSFVEGPPFTLQRLCEILLAPKSIYSNLSKLALALEKILLVTSTLTMCTEPYPSETIPNPADPENGNAETPDHSNATENGVEMMVSDYDEEMADSESDEGNQQNTPTNATNEKIIKISEAEASHQQLPSIQNPLVEASQPNE